MKSEWSLSEAARLLGQPQHKLIYLCEKGVIIPDLGDARSGSAVNTGRLGGAGHGGYLPGCVGSSAFDWPGNFGHSCEAPSGLLWWVVGARHLQPHRSGPDGQLPHGNNVLGNHSWGAQTAAVQEVVALALQSEPTIQLAAQPLA